MNKRLRYTLFLIPLLIFLLIIYSIWVSGGNCKQFQIDNLEMVASINLNEIKDYHCHFDEGSNTKQSVFILKDPLNPKLNDNTMVVDSSFMEKWFNWYDTATISDTLFHLNGSKLGYEWELFYDEPNRTIYFQIRS